MIGTLTGAGFPLELAVRAISVLDCYIYGFARQRQGMASGDEPRAEDRAEALQDNVPEDAYPHLSKMIAWTMVNGYDEDADFSFGLNLILDGLEEILKQTLKKPSGSPSTALPA
jgi:hypothetical protein